MSIIDESLDKLIIACNNVKQYISQAYLSCQNKGATIPSDQTANNLSACIDSIVEGITPSGDTTILDNGTYDITNFANAIVDVHHWSSGNITLSAGKNPVEVSGITDQNGISFTPKGFAFMLHPASTTNFTGSAYYLVSAMYDGSQCARIVAWNKNASDTESYYSVRANPSIPSNSQVVLSSGKFSLSVSSDAYKPIAGRYMWVAWG